MSAGARTIACSLVFLLLVANVPLSAQAAALPGLGMDQGSVAGLQQSGAPPTYGSYWVGAWMAVHGWAGLDNALKSAKATGVTPVIYWYYWGDSITPSCVENGCDGKTKAAWVSMTDTLADKVRTHMAGAPVIIVLENEFNKGGITDAWYAPTFDGYLEARANTLKAVPGVHITLGFGTWGESSWHRFPKAMAVSDSIGFQLMRASTRDSEASYRGSPQKIADTLGFIKQLSGKPGFLYDLALSSYPDTTYRTIQAETLKSILDRRAEYAQTGLVGIVYRELRDNPSMGTHNYFGIAEQFWGFKDKDGHAKPSWDVWRAANNAAGPDPQPAAPNVPGSFEAEAMVPTTGGKSAEAGASGGATWNVWTNGEVRQELRSEQGGPHRVTVVARGTPASGVDARMEIRLDGAVLAAHDVPAGLRSYAVDAALPAGASVLSVAFTNDARTATEDRNLYVDVVRVEAAPANQAPVARFTTSAADLTVAVDASGTTDADGDALTYAWTFGDGTTATGAQATKTYATAGSYAVTLTASDGKGASTASATVTVKAPNRAPAAILDAKGQDLDWSFDGAGSSDPDGDALTHAWDFGDGSTATGPTAARRYAAAGSYTVTLTVSDGHTNATATRTVAAKEPNRAPLAAFEASGADLSWSFDATGSRDPDGDALAYVWDFGDGTGATGATVSRNFEGAGDRTVTLTVSDGSLSATASRVVSAKLPNRAPTASFAMTGAAMTWTFDASASADADGDALAYDWTFGDGSTATGVRVTKAYAAAGDHPVTLTVRDGKASATATQTVPARLANRAPTADAAVSGADMTWSFDASASTDPDGDALSYQWTFSDGVTASGVRVTRTFTTPGDHSVRLQVGDGRGAGDETTRTVTARMPAAARLMQAEAFQVRENGVAFGDAGASEGRAWLLWANGAIRQAYAPGAGTYRVEVVAKGDYASGWPIMELRADGVLVGRWTVSSASWSTYGANVAFAAGQTRTLSVHFTNDHNTPTEDRNLRLDLVRLVPPGMAVEGEAFQTRANGASFGDSRASGGAAWLLWSNGAMTHKVSPGAGTWTVEVVAKGDHANGWPTMELRADGALVARWDVSSTSWQSYKADVTFGGTAKTLSVHFVNDYHGPLGDRNLRVDVMRLAAK